MKSTHTKCQDILYIIIPAYNEEANIKGVINDWYSVIEKFSGGVFQISSD